MKRAVLAPRCGVLAALFLVTTLAGCVNPPPASKLDAADRKGISSATQQALELVRTGESVNWANSGTGHRGSVTPTRTFAGTSGAPCRDFRHTAVAAGRTLVAHDTACRGDDGLWRSTRYGDVVASLDAPPYAAPPPPAHYPYYRPYYYPVRTSVHFGYLGWRGGHGRRHHRRGSRFHIGYGLYF